MIIMTKKKIIFLCFCLIIISLLALNYSRIIVEEKSCVGCGDCDKVCPVDAINILDGKAVIDQAICIKCEICLKSCTYNAIRKLK